MFAREYEYFCGKLLHNLRNSPSTAHTVFIIFPRLSAGGTISFHGSHWQKHFSQGFSSCCSFQPL